MEKAPRSRVADATSLVFVSRAERWHSNRTPFVVSCCRCSLFMSSGRQRLGMWLAVAANSTLHMGFPRCWCGSKQPNIASRCCLQLTGHLHRLAPLGAAVQSCFLSSQLCELRTLRGALSPDRTGIVDRSGGLASKFDRDAVIPMRAWLQWFRIDQVCQRSGVSAGSAKVVSCLAEEKPGHLELTWIYPFSERVNRKREGQQNKRKTKS